MAKLLPLPILSRCDFIRGIGDRELTATLESLRVRGMSIAPPMGAGRLAWASAFIIDAGGERRQAVKHGARGIQD